MEALNLNRRAMKVADALAERAHELGGSVQQVGGARIIDVGSKTPGSLAAGVELARICLADLATLQWSTMDIQGVTTQAILAEVRHPVAACMASQYAGWQVKVDKFFAMGSGPMRAASGREDIFDHIGHRETAPSCAVGVLECSKIPGENVIQYLTEKCRVKAENLTLVIARTASLACGVQVSARTVETAMHKLHTLGFDLSRVISGFGVAPVPPVAGDDMAGIGRTNDAVMYGGSVTLHVSGDDASLQDICPRLPASASRDHGKTFAEIFKRYDHDFYKIDPLLFSTACVCLHNLDTGKVHHAGKLEPAILAESFGY